MDSFPIPWVVGGDFNVVLDASERVGLSYNVGFMRSFSELISKAMVVDLSLHGMSFT